MMTVSEGVTVLCVQTYNHRWNGDDCEWKASLHCVYNPGWNGDDCECTILGGMVMTVRDHCTVCTTRRHCTVCTTLG